MVTKRTLSIALALVLACSLVTPAFATADDSDGPDAELTVTYDEFRTDDATIEQVNTSNQAAVVSQNTKATVEDSDAFSRVRLENANSYAVEFEVQISEEIVTASTLGSINPAEAENTDATASWDATHDFSADETYTSVTVTLPEDSEALYAPSQLRIESLSWTADLDEQADGILERAGNLLGTDTGLEHREHTFDGDEGEILTVDLEHNESGETIDDWHATYELENGDTRPLDGGSDAPVFYRSLEDEDDEVTGIQVTFNEGAEVEFTAEPRWRDTIEHSLVGYRSGLEEMFDFNLPLSATPEMPGSHNPGLEVISTW